MPRAYLKLSIDRTREAGTYNLKLSREDVQIDSKGNIHITFLIKNAESLATKKEVDLSTTPRRTIKVPKKIIRRGY